MRSLAGALDPNCPKDPKWRKIVRPHTDINSDVEDEQRWFRSGAAAVPRSGMGMGMGITLNGVGQGHITDRIVKLPRAGGVKRALVDMGKTCAPINLGQLATKCRIESKGKKALRKVRDAYYWLRSTPCIEFPSFATFGVPRREASVLNLPEPSSGSVRFQSKGSST